MSICLCLEESKNICCKHIETNHHANVVEMDKEEQIRACYQHAYLQYITNSKMSNATLRNRFGIIDESYTQVSRIIRETIEANFIKPANTQQCKKYSIYLPYLV